MLLPLYLLVVREVTPSQAGMLLIPSGLGMFCSYPMMGQLTERFGSRRVSSTGAFLALLGTLPFAFTAFNSIPRWGLGLTLFVRGVGLGAITIPSMAAAYASVPRETIPIATTAINIVQRMGGPIATTSLAIFLHTRMVLAPRPTPGAPLHGAPMAQAFATTFLLMCAFHAAAVLAALRLPLRAARHPQSLRPLEAPAR